MAFSPNPPPPADLAHLLPTCQQDLLRLIAWLDRLRELVVSRLSSNREMDAISVLGEGLLNGPYWHHLFLDHPKPLRCVLVG
jgi:hypothetical protein